MHVALVIAFIAGLSVAGCKKDQPSEQQNPAPTAPADQAGGAEPTAVEPDQADKGAARVIDIEVKKDGYHPASTEAKAGESLTLRFTRTEDTECGREIIVGDEKRELPMNEVVAFDITMPADGELVYTCGMEMMQGKVAIATE